MNTNNKFAEFVNKSNGLNRIPPLKMNIHVLIQAFADENLEPKELAAVLYRYPVISARLLGLANSAWARPVSPITDIETACVRLGYATIKSLSLALAVASSFNTTRCPSFNPIRFWMTSMLVAEGGALLAAKLPDKDQSAGNIKFLAPTAGILHNLGLLWLAANMAKETEEAIRLTAADPLLNVNQAVAECVGMDYCQVGAWLFKQWELPDELITVVAHHRDPLYRQDSYSAVLLVGAAANMVSRLFKECDEMPENSYLPPLGIEFAEQNKVFKQLANKLDATRELAESLFV
ncbi:MAG: HDOD domain-containing protein [Methylomonas sp.]|jgi:HD-like signal output (HDOD) protein